MISLEAKLRECAELYNRATRKNPDTVFVAQRQLDEDIQLAYDLIKHKYPSMVIITQGWSDIIVRASTEEMLSQPHQESLF